MVAESKCYKYAFQWDACRLLAASISQHALQGWCLLPGVSAPWGCLIPGGLLLGGVCHSPLWTEWQTSVKTLPCPTFVAGGKYETIVACGHASFNIRGWLAHWVLIYLTALFTKPPAGGRNDLRDRSPIHGFRVFQELYQVKLGTVLPAALWIALLKVCWWKIRVKFELQALVLFKFPLNSKEIFADEDFESTVPDLQ